MQNTCPCVIVSPACLNKSGGAIIIPLTTADKDRGYPYRSEIIEFQGKKQQAALNQIRWVSESRFIEYKGRLNNKTVKPICEALVEIFTYPHE